MVSHLGRHVLPRDGHVHVTSKLTTHCLASTAFYVHLVIVQRIVTRLSITVVIIRSDDHNSNSE